MSDNLSMELKGLFNFIPRLFQKSRLFEEVTSDDQNYFTYGKDLENQLELKRSFQAKSSPELIRTEFLKNQYHV